MQRHSDEWADFVSGGQKPSTSLATVRSASGVETRYSTFEALDCSINWRVAADASQLKSPNLHEGGSAKGNVTRISSSVSFSQSPNRYIQRSVVRRTGLTSRSERPALGNGGATMESSDPSTNPIRSQRGFRASIGLTVAVLCLVLRGGDTPIRQRLRERGCTKAAPGDLDYCASTKCGPCVDGEGDCNPGQCQAGYSCVEEGAVDHCRPVVSGCASASPGDLDYCASNKCGPCTDGEGDCDPGQCDAGLQCVEEGAIDHCRPIVSGCASASPGDLDYCASNKCGPCADGEGDCDPGQCEAGLECVEEGAVDHCRPVASGSSNFQVDIGGVWEGVCCNGSSLEVSDLGCHWTESGRLLTDETAGLQLNCPEGGPTDCMCSGTGEHMHGAGGGDLRTVRTSNGGPIFSNSAMETCVYVSDSGELKTEWTDSSCPDFRLK